MRLIRSSRERISNDAQRRSGEYLFIRFLVVDANIRDAAAGIRDPYARFNRNEVIALLIPKSSDFQQSPAVSTSFPNPVNRLQYDPLPDGFLHATL
jgi:hypothetical protein